MSTDVHWESWGARDPYFGVLTHPKFRASALTREAKEEFFDSGRAHVTYLLDMCRRHIDPGFHPHRILDFGCGVGRVIIPFAEISAEVVGMDVSPSMLAEAHRNCNERNLNSVSLLISDDCLSNSSGLYDLVHSCIVLQHIEVARGRAIFAELIDRIRPGGIGAIQVTYGWEVHADNFGQSTSAGQPVSPQNFQATFMGHVRALLRPLFSRKANADSLFLERLPAAGDPEMQMNYYNLSELMFILQQSGVQRLHTEFTDHGGALGVFLFFQRSLAA